VNVDPIADPGAPLVRRNPVAKLGAMFVLAFGLLATLDPVAPALALAVELALVRPFGLRYRTLLRRGWPLLASALGLAVVHLVFGTVRTGAVLLDAGPLTVTAGSAAAAGGLALRVLAVTLPGVLVFAGTDPTDLADALVQQVRVPARFAIGALAALRLLPLLADEWELLVLARRARGVDAGRNPFTRLRLFASALFGLLVGAIRRGTRLAAAMDARGFDSGVTRTIARPQVFTAADGALLVGAVAILAAALTASVATGMFHPVL
jgi:energy-coupling factor transport system permease protein